MSKEQWSEIVARAKNILTTVSNIPVQWECDVDEPPTISDDCIRFNGVEEDGHETFFIPRTGTDWEFCKTARKPYDTVVVAMLTMLNDVNPDFTWTSDGTIQDHQEGRELYAASLKVT